jgi:hypothetical protein
VTNPQPGDKYRVVNHPQFAAGSGTLIDVPGLYIGDVVTILVEGIDSEGDVRVDGTPYDYPYMFVQFSSLEKL